MSEYVDWLSLSDSRTSVGAELDPSSSWALAPVLREGVPNWASGGVGRARGLGVGYRAGGGTIIWCASPSSKMAKESSLREVVRGLSLAQKGTPVCCLGWPSSFVKVSEAEWLAR